MKNEMKIDRTEFPADWTREPDRYTFFKFSHF